MAPIPDAKEPPLGNLSRYRWTLALLFLAFLGGCAAVQQELGKMMNFTKCQFRLASVDQVSLVGIPLALGASTADITPMNLLKLQSGLTQGTLPLQFNVNVEAKNPNSSPAGMSRMEWILFLDGNRMTSGLLDKEVDIEARATGNVPLTVSLDLTKVLSGQALDSMVNLALNIAGEGTHPTHISLQVKPSITVQGQTLDYPGYITLNQDFGAN